ncbi:hypothetical protein ACLB2K_038110 [Fragaria x ananassa]
MGSKTLFKWSKQITCSQVGQLIKSEKDLQKALIIFDSATAEYTNGFRHDHDTFGLMICRLVSANQFRSAEALLDRMKEEKCSITEDIFLSVCRGYARVHRPLDSIRVLDKMEDYHCKPTEKSYITIFGILVEENQLKVAFRFYKYMRKTGIPASVVSLNILIKALCKNSSSMDAALQIFREMPDHGCTPDPYTYGTLINGLCKLGKIGEAKELFHEMGTKGCLPSVVTYTCLIRDMNCKGISPNVFTYSSLMDGFCKGGRSSEAMELLDLMVSKRLLPNIVTYSTLLHGLCEEGKLREALEILDKMKLQGLKPDAGQYGKIITGFCNVSKFQEAANFLDEMVFGGISPNRLTWSLHVRIHNAVVQGLCNSGNLTRAFQLYLSMRTRGFSIDAETFDTLVKCICKKGDLHKAYRIVDETVLDGCIPDYGIWNAVVEGFWDRTKVREPAELLQAELMSKLADE